MTQTEVLTSRGDEGWKLRRKPNWLSPCSQEKPQVECCGRPYRKPTQVGGESIPRRMREPWLRNSATLHRNFGRRCTRKGEEPCAQSSRGSQ